MNGNYKCLLINQVMMPSVLESATCVDDVPLAWTMKNCGQCCGWWRYISKKKMLNGYKTSSSDHRRHTCQQWNHDIWLNRILWMRTGLKGWLNVHEYKTSHLIKRDTQVDKIDKVTLMCLMVRDEESNPAILAKSMANVIGCTCQVY